MEAHRPAITAAKRKMAEEEEKRWKTPRRQTQNPQKSFEFGGSEFWVVRSTPHGTTPPTSHACTRPLHSS